MTTGDFGDDDEEVALVESEEDFEDPYAERALAALALVGSISDREIRDKLLQKMVERLTSSIPISKDNAGTIHPLKKREGGL